MASRGTPLPNFWLFESCSSPTRGLRGRLWGLVAHGHFRSAVVKALISAYLKSPYSAPDRLAPQQPF